GSGPTPPASALWKSPSSADGKVVEKRGGNGPQRVRAFQAPKRLNKPNLFPTGCHRLPSESHGKDGVDGSSPSEGFSEAPPPRRAVRHGSRLGTPPCPSLPTGIRASTPGGSRMAGSSIPRWCTCDRCEPPASTRSATRCACSTSRRHRLL